MQDPHIVKSYDEQLKRLHDLVWEMGVLAIRQLEMVLQSLETPDEALAAPAADGEDQINRLEQAVGEQVVRLLALRSPVANDLRAVIAALKIASALERTGDYTNGMVRRALTLDGHHNFASVRALRRLGALVRHHLTDVMTAYASGDTAAALVIRERDRDVDVQYSSLFRELLTYMMEDPRNVAPCSHLVIIAKNLERVGDLTTNIAEMVHFSTTGNSTPGERPKGDTTYAV